jgi:membrane protease YdiL (CAAX protease family)
MNQSSFGDIPPQDPLPTPGGFGKAPPTERAADELPEALPPPRRSPLPAAIAWVLILSMTTAAFVLNIVAKKSQAAGGEDRIGVVLMDIQGKYLVGAAELQGQGGMLWSASERRLNVGSIDQRQRAAVLAGELVGDEAASGVLSELGNKVFLLDEESEADRIEVTREQQRIQEILIRIYTPPINLDDMAIVPSKRTERIEDVPDDDREFLMDELGWYGKLALAPADDSADRSLREQVIGSAQVVFIIIIGVVIAAGLAGLAGFAGLIVLLVMAISGRVRSGLGPRVSYHGVYAETFALWMLLFFGIQRGVAAWVTPEFRMLTAGLGFFVSLVALLWPVIRGVRWQQVRQDIGWTLGRQPALEPIAGLGGYLMALPLLGIGVCITLGLMFLQEALKGPDPEFGPSGGPAHPIIEQLAGAGLWPKIQILLLASIAAPIVEETMFRGVLYRHLRDGTRRWGVVASILIAGSVSGFLFAAIHPQGWVAIPALMSLAYAFVIVREWRGTLIPAMIIHGVSNGLVMTMLMVLLST